MQKTIVWFHIPKTAGTSLVAEIGRVGLPWVHILPGRFLPEHGAVLGSARDHLRAERDKALNGAFRIMFGHMTQRDFLAAVGRHPNFQFATMLRDPVERLFSEYRYATQSPAQPNRAYILQRYPSFDCFVDDMVDSNVLAHYLEEYRGEPVSKIVARLAEEYLLVGSVETYGDDLLKLRSILGASDHPPFWLNASPTVPLPLASGTILKIRERNARDVELYESYIARRFA